MQICITQRDGIRYFSRFKNIPERDRLEVELTIEDGKPRIYRFDLTDALFEKFEEHPEVLHRKRVVEPDMDRPAKRARSSKPRAKASPKVAAAGLQIAAPAVAATSPVKAAKIARARMAAPAISEVKSPAQKPKPVARAARRVAAPVAPPLEAVAAPPKRSRKQPVVEAKAPPVPLKKTAKSAQKKSPVVAKVKVPAAKLPAKTERKVKTATSVAPAAPKPISKAKRTTIAREVKPSVGIRPRSA